MSSRGILWHPRSELCGKSEVSSNRETIITKEFWTAMFCEIGHNKRLITCVVNVKYMQLMPRDGVFSWRMEMTLREISNIRSGTRHRANIPSICINNVRTGNFPMHFWKILRERVVRISKCKNSARILWYNTLVYSLIRNFLDVP